MDAGGRATQEAKAEGSPNDALCLNEFTRLHLTLKGFQGSACSRPLFQTRLNRTHPWGRTASMIIMDDTNEYPNIITSCS